MEYVSTRNNRKIFTFKDVFLKGLAPDGGLFIPNEIPKFSHLKIHYQLVIPCQNCRI